MCLKTFYYDNQCIEYPTVADSYSFYSVYAVSINSMCFKSAYYIYYEYKHTTVYQNKSQDIK